MTAATVQAWQQRPRPAPPKTTVAPPSSASPLEQAAEEFKVLTQERGLRSDSSSVNKRTSTSRAAIHGRIYENFRNDRLDATPHEVVQRGGDRNMLRRNQFGFNVGGPVVIPRVFDGSRTTFFNVSYEGVRETIGRSFLRTIAIAPERTGNFSQTVDNAGAPLPIFDPNSTRPNPNFDPAQDISENNLQYLRDPFPANTIPASRIDPVAARSVAYYPLPNSDAGPFFRNNYFVFSPERNRADGMIFRVDHAPAEAHRITFNGSFTNGLAVSPRYFDTIADSNSNDRQFRARRGILDWTFTKSASTINTLTFDVNSDRSINGRPDQENAVDEIGLAGPLGGAFPVFRFSPYLGMGRNSPVSVYSHNYFTLSESFSTRAGKHRLRAAATTRRTQVNAYMPENPAGSFQFGPSITSLPGIVNTGHGFASFLLGNAESASATITTNPSYWRGRTVSLSLRDNYEFSRSLNFTISGTMEISLPRTEKYDRFSTVSMEEINPENGQKGALVFASQNGQGRSFQPVRVRPETSFGFAWNPRGNPKSVVRGSYGLSFTTVPVYTTQWPSQGFIGTPTFISPNIQLQPALVLREGMPDLSHPLPDLRPEAANNTAAGLVESTGAQPMYQSAGISFEREFPGQSIVSVNLGHARGQRLFVSGSAANPNAVPLDNLEYRDALNTEAFRRTLRPYPQYQRFDVHSSWPVGNYKRNAGSVRVEKRSSSGLTMNATYEWSKQMDDYSGPYGIQDFYNRSNEWSLTSSNNPHRISLSYNYELPFGSKKAFLAYSDWRRFVVDGWTVSGITSLQSGEPLALRPQFNNTGGIVDSLRVNLVPGSDPTVSSQGPDLWFNPAAFDQPADFTLGNGPRTHPYILNPGGQNHDVSVTKRISLTTESSLEVMATGFNFTNTGNWSDPDNVIGPATAPNVNAGKIIGSVGGRVIQLGMRLSF